MANSRRASFARDLSKMEPRGKGNSQFQLRQMNSPTVLVAGQSHHPESQPEAASGDQSSDWKPPRPASVRVEPSPAQETTEHEKSPGRYGWAVWQILRRIHVDYRPRIRYGLRPDIDRAVVRPHCIKIPASPISRILLDALNSLVDSAGTSPSIGARELPALINTHSNRTLGTLR
jgi:hypothetical protein